MYKLIQLQNASNFSDSLPTIVISKNNPAWDEAYKNWISGKNPTESKEWEKGVVGIFEYVEWKNHR